MAEPNLRIKITAENQADKALQSVNKSLDSVQQSAQKVSGSVDKFGASLKQAGGSGNAFSAVGKELNTVEGTLKGAVGSVTRFGDSLKSIGAPAIAAITALGAAFGGIVKSITGAIDVAADYEQRFATIQATLEATGYAAGLTADEIRSMAQEIALGTLESTEGVERAAQKLLTFKAVGSDSFRTVLELGTDLAALGFGSLESNVVRLGQALEDPEQGLSRLRRVGVSFTEDQKALIESLVASGRAAEAQGIILEAVAGQVGGAGAAAAAGVKGAWDTFSQRVEELNVEIGQAFMGISSATANAGTALAEWARTAVQETKAVIDAVGSLGRAISEGLTNATGSIREATLSLLGLSESSDDLLKLGSSIDSAVNSSLKLAAAWATDPFKIAKAGIIALADLFKSSGDRQKDAIASVNDELQKQSAALGEVGSKVEGVASSIKAQFDAVKGALAEATNEIDNLSSTIFDLQSSGEDFLLEMMGADEATRAAAEYKRTMEEIASVKERIANAETDGDTERQVELQRELVELLEQAARAADETGNQDKAVALARERNDLSKEMASDAKEAKTDQEQLTEQFREQVQMMNEMVTAADGVAEKLGMMGEGEGINLDIDMDAFQSQIDEMEQLIKTERQLEVGYDDLLAIKEELQALDSGLSLERKLTFDSNLSEIIEQRESLKEEITSKVAVETTAEEAKGAIDDAAKDRGTEIEATTNAEQAGADLDAVSEQDRTASFEAEANTGGAEADLDALTSQTITATVDAQADTSGAESDLDSLGKGVQATVTAKADTGAAESAIRRLERNTSSTHTVYVREVKQSATGGLMGSLASVSSSLGSFRRRSGRIRGPGTGTSDSIPAMLSNGEFVIRADSVRKYGLGFLDRLNRGLLADIPRFATGGPVTNNLISTAPGQDLPEMAINLSVQGGQPMRLGSSRETARELATALRNLERGR